MISCGIVAEYNPFHNGHKYQIDKVRRELKPDVVIAVMSGNFLQRGEPALLDKWTRTKMALAGGVDLVIELPAVFAIQPADFFAKGAIQLFAQLGVKSLSFGVEQGTATDFMQGAKWMVENEAKLGAAIKKDSAVDMPYAHQMERAISNMEPDFPLHLNSPNNQLGFAYAKEIIKQNEDKKIQLFPILRKVAQYDEQELNKEQTIASATALRLALLEGRDVSSFIPAAAYVHLKENKEKMVTWSNYFPQLKYQITVSSKDQLENIYQMNEGLENRLKSHIDESFNFNEFIANIKTKRYTQTRLQRLLTYVLLQWKNEAVMTTLENEAAIRVLGFSKAGRSYLSQVKRQLTVPLLTNVNQSTEKWVPLDIGAGEIYRLGKNDQINIQDFKQKPVKCD